MLRKIICLNAILAALLVAAVLIYPPVRALLDLRDPALRQPGTPAAAWRGFHYLTPRFAAWARARREDGRAATTSTNDVSGTEWPLFGTVFYLWSVENFQTAWDAGDHAAGVEPRVFARDAVIAATELVTDPRQAGWVKKHWGDDYLHRENVFYRTLLISALTAREKLLGDKYQLEVLRDQVESLARELDAAPTGLLLDYPRHCYPGDVMRAWWSVRRADPVLGTDHSRQITRALRSFTGIHTTRRQLPPYSASPDGKPNSDARGCANSYMLLSAPELWPVAAREWFDLYDKSYWQERLTAAGYREFAPDRAGGSDWTLDSVDAGPVVGGYGVTACAFGLGAARLNGRFDRAYPLTAELLATMWELPTGERLIPRLLSNAADAPLLGEAAFLWHFTLQPAKGFPVKTGGALPLYAELATGLPLLLAAFLLLVSGYNFASARRLKKDPEITAPGLQIGAWAFCLGGAGGTWATGHPGWALLLFLAALAFPRLPRRKAPKGTEDWEANSAPPPAAPKV